MSPAKILVVIVACFFTLATAVQARTRYTVALVLTIITFMMAGCAPVPTKCTHLTPSEYVLSFMGYIGGFLLYDYLKPRSRVIFRTALALAIVGLAISMAGCAALPMPFQPVNEQDNSNTAEGTWLVLDGVDTAYTMHLKKGTSCDHEGDPAAAFVYGSQNPPPARVFAINLGLALGHTMVTSWLDDKVAEADAKDDGSVGVWYVGRIAWHTASIAYSFIGARKGYQQGCHL